VIDIEETPTFKVARWATSSDPSALQKKSHAARNEKTPDLITRSSKYFDHHPVQMIGRVRQAVKPGRMRCRGPNSKSSRGNHAERFLRGVGISAQRRQIHASQKALSVVTSGLRFMSSPMLHVRWWNGKRAARALTPKKFVHATVQCQYNRTAFLGK